MHLSHPESTQRRAPSSFSRARRACVRTWSLGLLAVLVCCAAPLSASAAPPSLQAPGGGTSVTEGSSVTYEWSGDLMGDPGERDRAFFVVEVIATSKMPSGQQAAWDADTSRQTTPGSSATSAELGAPPAGNWKWRVCAWGVVDASVVQTVQQIPDGCSSSRSLTSAVRTDNLNGEVAVVDEKRTVTEARPPTVIEKVRPADPAAITPSPVPTTPRATTPETIEVVEEAPIKTERGSSPTSSGSSSSSSKESGSKTALALGGGGSLAGDAPGSSSGGDEATTADRGAVASAVSNSLSATIPGVPIPFWTLLFLFASLPVAIAWRRNVLGMFDWSDGSIDGYGTEQGEAVPVLASVQRAPSAQGFPPTADGGARTASTTEAPSWGDAA